MATIQFQYHIVFSNNAQSPRLYQGI